MLWLYLIKFDNSYELKDYFKILESFLLFR